MRGNLYSDLGQPLALGPELGRGGEGAVFLLAGSPNLVVKLYHRVPEAERVAKLKGLLAQPDPALRTVAAWPVGLVFNGRRQVVGYQMPQLVQYHPLHQLYSPRDRQRHFAGASVGFVLHTALNVARVFGTLHRAGVVVGDVNHSNLLVNGQSLVRCIDCDSLQVAVGGQVFPSQVGAPEYTPPELQQTDLTGRVRTPQHDAFGLAVLVFQLLFLGRHPFAGRYRGVGELPLGQAIAEGRFPYLRSGASADYLPPPGSLPLEAFGPEVATLFCQAFAPIGAGSARPTAETWAEALARLEATLIPCTVNPLHAYPAPSTTCPWCGLAYEYYPSAHPSRTDWDALKRELDRQWQALEQLQAPAQAIGTLQRLLAELAALERRLQRLPLRPTRWLRWLAQAHQRKQLLAQSQALVRALNALRAQLPPTSAATSLAAALAQLAERRQAALEAYHGLREKADALQARARQRQLGAYLRQCALSEHRIPTVGPKTRSQLFALGIYSAADVPDDRRLLKGLRKEVRDALGDWKLACAAQFRFDANETLHRQELDRALGSANHPFALAARQFLATAQALQQQAHAPVASVAGAGPGLLQLEQAVEALALAARGVG